MQTLWNKELLQRYLRISITKKTSWLLWFWNIHVKLDQEQNVRQKTDSFEQWCKKRIMKISWTKKKWRRCEFSKGQPSVQEIDCRLRSRDSTEYRMPRRHSALGELAFSFTGPLTRNKLPPTIRTFLIGNSFVNI